jgi:hypothetical protein
MTTDATHIYLATQSDDDKYQLLKVGTMEVLSKADMPSADALKASSIH